MQAGADAGPKAHVKPRPVIISALSASLLRRLSNIVAALDASLIGTTLIVSRAANVQL